MQTPTPRTNKKPSLKKHIAVGDKGGDSPPSEMSEIGLTELSGTDMDKLDRQAEHDNITLAKADP
jgi:hypothetical protein